MINQLSKLMLMFSLALVLIAPQAMANNQATAINEEPSGLAMTGDLILVRPTMFVLTVLGAGVWLVSLPFSLAGGNAKQAGDTLVAQPAMHTFVRCLGCTKAGYKKELQTSEDSEKK